MRALIREALKYFASALVFGLIDDAVEWLRATLRELFARSSPEAEPAALPPAASASVFEGTAAEEPVHAGLV